MADQHIFFCRDSDGINCTQLSVPAHESGPIVTGPTCPAMVCLVHIEPVSENQRLPRPISGQVPSVEIPAVMITVGLATLKDRL